ncbi:unnamed protein product, partial [Penicillium nalgiovense]
MKGFIGGIPVALLAVAAQAKFAERQENDFHPQAGGTAIGGPSGNDGHGHFHPQTGGTAIGGPSGNDVDGGFVSPYSANIKTDTKVNEWQKDDHSVKLKHTDVYPHPAVVPVPFGHGAQAPGMGPFGKGKRGVPGGTAMGGPSGNDEGQSFDMSVTGVFNTETEEENQDDHSTEIEHTDVHPAPVHVHPAGPAPGIFRPGTFAKRFGEPHSGGTAIGGPSGNDGGQSFSAPTNIKTDTGISEHNEDNHSIDLEHEDVYPHPHTGAFSPFRRSVNFGPPGHGAPGHFEPHPESHFEPHPESHYEPHPESHYAPHSESHYEPHQEPHYEPHPEPHYVNHQEPHVEHHPEPHYAPHYSPTYAPHNEPHKTFESELTAVKHNNNGPGAGGIAFGRRAYAPTPETGATVIGGPSGNDESTGFSAPTNIGVATDVNEHNEDNHAIEGEFTDVHAPADYSREDAPACAAKVQEIVHTVTKTQYHTALETNAIPVHAPAKSVGADPYVNYPEHTEHSAGADPYANYPEHSAGSDPYANYPEHSTGSDPYAKYPEHSEHPAGADPYAPSGPDSSNHGSEGVPYVHVPMASSAVATSAVYNYPEHSAGADPYAPHKYGASQGPSYSKIAVHVPMATPASYGVFSKATPSGSMGHMIPTGVAAHKASASASASPSASHGMMFQGDAARLSGVLLDIKPLRIQPPPPISKMVQQDPHQGGTLSEMAQGTSMPNDAGKMNTIPSVPRPDQRAEHSDFDNEGIALPSTAMAADNTTDWPRSTRDVGQSGEVISGTGNSMEAGIEAKRTYMGPNHHAGHGESREIKGGKYGQSVFDRYQAE